MFYCSCFTVAAAYSEVYYEIFPPYFSSLLQFIEREDQQCLPRLFLYNNLSAVLNLWYDKLLPVVFRMWVKNDGTAKRWNWTIQTLKTTGGHILLLIWAKLVC